METPRLLFATLSWSALTYVGLRALPRIVADGPEQLVDPEWHVGAHGTGVVEAGGDRVSIRTGPCEAPAEDVRCGGFAEVGIDPHDEFALVVAAELRWDGVTDAGSPGVARVVHPIRNARGEESWAFPHLSAGGRVAPTQDWTRFEDGFLVDPTAHRVLIMAQLQGTDGELEVRNLSVRPASWSRAWLAIVSILAAGWIAIAGVVARTLLAGADRRWAAWLTLALGLAYLPLLLTPEPAGVVLLRAIFVPEPEAPVADAASPSPAAVAAPAPEPRRLLVARELARHYDDGDVHLVMFIFIGWSAGYLRRKGDVTTLLGLLTYAIASEAIQELTIGRGIQGKDVLLDGLGAAIGLGTARAAQWRRTA